MNDRDLNFVRAQLQSALPPWRGEGPATDLWPRMVKRLEPPVRFGWLEAALVAAIVVTLVAWRDLVPAILYSL